MKGLEELGRSLRNLGSVIDLLKSAGENTEDVFDIDDNFQGSKAMQVCVDRVKAIPAARQMMEERYMGPPIDLDALSTLSRGTLGHTYASVMKALGYDPNFYRVREIKSDEDWLILRLRKTHDIRHVVSGFGPTGGEAGVLAIVGVQIGHPLSVLIPIVNLAATLKMQPENLEVVTHQIARGMSMGLEAKPFVAQRWEEMWDKPLAQIRQDMNITKPVIDEPYSLKNRLPDLDLPW